MKKYLLLIFISILFIAKADAQISWGLFHALVDSCDFTVQNNFITVDTSNNNLWQIGKSHKTFFGSSKGILTDSTNVYPKNNHSVFEYKTPSYFGCNILSITHKYETDVSKAGGYIEYYNWLDSSWYNLGLGNIQKLSFPEQVFSVNLYTQNDTLFNGQPGFSGTQNNWITTQFQWVWEYEVRRKSMDSLKIRFHFMSDSTTSSKSGWMIGKIALYTIGFGGGINEMKKNNIVSIFPNPTTSTFTISKNTNEALQFHLYNLIGQQVFNKNLVEAETTIERNNLATGTYLFSITNTSGKIIENDKLIFE